MAAQQEVRDFVKLPKMLRIEDVAKYFDISIKTTYALAKRGDIPGFKVGGKWRFRAVDLLEWARHQIVTAGVGRAQRQAQAEARQLLSGNRPLPSVPKIKS